MDDITRLKTANNDVKMLGKAITEIIEKYEETQDLLEKERENNKLLEEERNKN